MKPEIVYCTVTGFAQDGPDGDKQKPRGTHAAIVPIRR
jgi:crotonobetainyl-CoA:carnitine CoA-transferase CaiB-like acyl-CoA transferase